MTGLTAPQQGLRGSILRESPSSSPGRSHALSICRFVSSCISGQSLCPSPPSSLVGHLLSEAALLLSLVSFVFLSVNFRLFVSLMEFNSCCSSLSEFQLGAVSSSLPFPHFIHLFQNAGLVLRSRGFHLFSRCFRFFSWSSCLVKLPVNKWHQGGKRLEGISFCFLSFIFSSICPLGFAGSFATLPH